MIHNWEQLMLKSELISQRKNLHLNLSSLLALQFKYEFSQNTKPETFKYDCQKSNFLMDVVNRDISKSSNIISL